MQVEFLYVFLRLWCPWQLRPDLFAAGFALGSNTTANCSNTTVYVCVTIFALCGPVGVLVGFEATRLLAATGVGLLIAVASGTFLYSHKGLSCDFGVPCNFSQSPLPLGSAKKHHTFFAAVSARQPESVTSSLLSPNASVGQKFCSSPRRKHVQCLRQTFPLSGSIATARFHWYKSQRILRHFFPEQHEV